MYKSVFFCMSLFDLSMSLTCNKLAHTCPLQVPFISITCPLHASSVSLTCLLCLLSLTCPKHLTDRSHFQTFCPVTYLLELRVVVGGLAISKVAFTTKNNLLGTISLHFSCFSKIKIYEICQKKNKVLD